VSHAVARGADCAFAVGYAKYVPKMITGSCAAVVPWPEPAESERDGGQGIRKFVKTFYLDRSGRPFGCNTPVAQNGLEGEWLPRPNDDQPKRYAFFRVEPADPDAAVQRQHGAVLLEYGRGGNRGYDIARILRDYLVRIEPGSDDLLLGKAYFVVAGARLASSFFLVERYRPLRDAAALARRQLPSYLAVLDGRSCQPPERGMVTIDPAVA
jgi:hypothetical protein